MAKKLLAVLMVCLVVAAAVDLRVAAEDDSGESQVWKECFKTCLKSCAESGKDSSRCEMKCDNECDAKEQTEKLNNLGQQ